MATRKLARNLGAFPSPDHLEQHLSAAISDFFCFARRFHQNLAGILWRAERLEEAERHADGMTFSYDLSDLGNTYRAYEKVMAHWREMLPVPMCEIEYDTLVADQERISRELVAFCGLEWDARCLRFYDNQRTLNTASNWQVRQPIHKSAVERWKRYEPWLGDLKAALQGGG